MPTKDEIFEKIQVALVDALGVDEEDVTPEATLVGDLGADGKVTEVGLEELRKRMPFANLDEFTKNPVVQDFGNLLTVADMCRFVEGKVELTD